MESGNFDKNEKSAEESVTENKSNETVNTKNTSKAKAVVALLICLILAIGIFKGISLIRSAGQDPTEESKASEPDWGRNSLKGVNYNSTWVSAISCIKSCLDYLGADVSLPWLYGGTGHAFMIHINNNLDASGPVSWNSVRFGELCRNIGFESDEILSWKSAPDFKDKQLKAYEFVQNSIDEGNPCFGWELDIPEFETIYGYEDGQYLFINIFGTKGKKKWDELGLGVVNVLFVVSIKTVKPSGDKTTVRDALDFAIKYSNPPVDKEGYFNASPGFVTGPAAYDTWITALEEGTADGMGTSYNAQCWSECRANALAFLKEARSRLDGKYSADFDKAIKHYETVSKNMETVARVFPFSNPNSTNPMNDNVKDKERCSKAVAALAAARDAEKAGLQVLSEIAAQL